MRMSGRGMSHEESLKKVCAVCTNLCGKKATRGVSETDERLIQKLVFSSYHRGSPYFPQGLCEGCHMKLWHEVKDGERGSGQKFLLPENYHCTLPKETRSQSKEYCRCRWCSLARMNGLELRRWQKQAKEEREGKDEIGMMCPKCGKGLPISQKSHQCSSSDMDTIANMLQSIPHSLKPKLAHSLLKELQGDQGGSLHLPPATALWFERGMGPKIQARIYCAGQASDNKCLCLINILTLRASLINQCTLGKTQQI